MHIVFGFLERFCNCMLVIPHLMFIFAFHRLILSHVNSQASGTWFLKSELDTMTRNALLLFIQSKQKIIKNSAVLTSRVYLENHSTSMTSQTAMTSSQH
jgi:hypothetical protein